MIKLLFANSLLKKKITYKEFLDIKFLLMISFDLLLQG